MKRVLIQFEKKGKIKGKEYKKGTQVSVLPCIAEQKVEVEKVAKKIEV